jgi:hypothetical protein
VALRATLSSGASRHLLSKEGSQRCRFATDFVLCLKRRHARPRSKPAASIHSAEIPDQVRNDGISVAPHYDLGSPERGVEARFNFCVICAMRSRVFARDDTIRKVHHRNTKRSDDALPHNRHPEFTSGSLSKSFFFPMIRQKSGRHPELVSGSLLSVSSLPNFERGQARRRLRHKTQWAGRNRVGLLFFCRAQRERAERAITTRYALCAS